VREDVRDDAGERLQAFERGSGAMLEGPQRSQWANEEAELHDASCAVAAHDVHTVDRRAVEVAFEFEHRGVADCEPFGVPDLIVRTGVGDVPVRKDRDRDDDEAGSELLAEDRVWADRRVVSRRRAAVCLSLGDQQRKLRPPRQAPAGSRMTADPQHR
jgi:hypothetical protein